MNVQEFARHRVRAVKEIDSKSIVVKLAGSSPVGVALFFCSFRGLHSILFYSIRLPGFDGHEKKERLAVLRVI